jgi:GNAT superfamily N-acetyltransferase
MHNPDYVVRYMKPEEVQLAADWAAAEGWNPGLHDAKAFYAADPTGFLIGLADGVPVAVISAVRYGHEFAFIGFYIAHPDYRDQGYGFRLARQAIKRCQEVNTGLDGVLDKVEIYGQIGFKLAYRNGRWKGVSAGKPDKRPIEIVDVRKMGLTAVSTYDRMMFPAERKVFLKAWLTEPAHKGLAWVEGGKIKGYGVIRPCRTGYKVGPLFADNQEIARELYLALAGQAPGGAEVFWDTPMINEPAVAIAREMGMSVVFETARMYSKGPPDIDVGRVFGVTTFELG